MNILQNYSQNSFLSIPIDWYSTALSVGVLMILIFLVIHIFLVAFSPKFREKMFVTSERKYLGIIGTLSLLSTIFALTYQWGFGLLVCELCWWQRIFMFPIEIIVFASIFQKIRGNSLAIGILAAFGIFFAGYHYFLHFKSWVLWQDISSMTSCAEGGILPSCTDPAGVLIFGFLTIPFMALVIFLAILWLSFLAFWANKSQK